MEKWRGTSCRMTTITEVANATTFFVFVTKRLLCKPDYTIMRLTLKPIGVGMDRRVVIYLPTYIFVFIRVLDR